MAIVPPHTHPRHEHSQYATAAELAAVAAAAVPIGAIMPFGGTVAPDGWHLCNGTAHGSAALQAVIGSANTPDLRDKFIVGAGSSYANGATGGAATVALSVDQMPAHAHGGATTGGGQHSHTYSRTQKWPAGAAGAERFVIDNAAPDGYWDNTNSTTDHGHGINAQGGGQAHENRPPYYALTYIIKKA